MHPNWESIEHDYMALGVMVKGLVVQVVFSLILPVRMRNLRPGRILLVNGWLQSWYQQQGFSFHDHETLTEDQHLLGLDGEIYPLMKWGKIIFANRLVYWVWLRWS